jgi:N6-adenosine-specific RNA methylase IME4
MSPYQEAVAAAEQAMHCLPRTVRASNRNCGGRAVVPAGSPPLPPGPYEVIYADPPWRFKAGHTGREAERHYPTMSLEEICALPVGSIAAKDAVLLMWVTVPFLAHGHEVVRAWGFKYKSCASWDKLVAGTGFWFRGRHELLLLATRGSPRAPLPANRPPSVLTVRKGGHSAKPAEARALIERMLPRRSRIELFARPPVAPGWDAWGDELAGGVVLQGAGPLGHSRLLDESGRTTVIDGHVRDPQAGRNTRAPLCRPTTGVQV